ncbi:MAG: GHKL domain-containing protein [Pirellulales bacterium]|nr:GHKL domain-containing protein [Pirellulales bacterium]
MDNSSFTTDVASPLGNVPVGAPPTHFAPAGRVSVEELQRQRNLVSHAPLLGPALDSFPALVLVLNKNRQVIGANQAVFNMLGAEMDDLLGRRPGEIIGCARPSDGPDGCGTAPGCVTCGAINAVLLSQQMSGQCTKECRLSLDGSGPADVMDLRVTATTMQIEGEMLTLCTIEDISENKRLRVLNRAFFHDVLNTAGGICGFSRFLVEISSNNPAQHELSSKLLQLSDQLLEEIEVQRDLMAAETGDLEVHQDAVLTRKILEDLVALYSKHQVAQQRHIVVEDHTSGPILTDPRLLRRVLGNLLKNALEATELGGTVTVRCEEESDAVLFKVHNASVMSREVQYQVFQRSFSTKGQPGRGVGTYSIRLLAERYLGGQVSFSSKDGEGTTFTVCLPKHADAQQ